MSNKIRIVKRYKPGTPKAGIEEADIVEVGGGSDGCARFVAAVNANPRIDYEIVDYEAALVTNMERPEVIHNPTGGSTGRLLVPGKDFPA